MSEAYDAKSVEVVVGGRKVVGYDDGVVVSEPTPRFTEVRCPMCAATHVKSGCGDYCDVCWDIAVIMDHESNWCDACDGFGIEPVFNGERNVDSVCGACAEGATLEDLYMDKREIWQRAKTQALAKRSDLI